jgi:hypothetical protein
MRDSAGDFQERNIDDCPVGELHVNAGRCVLGIVDLVDHEVPLRGVALMVTERTGFHTNVLGKERCSKPGRAGSPSRAEVARERDPTSRRFPTDRRC